MEGSRSHTSKSSVVMANQRKPIRLENPFSFKVFQLFTGFGVGCGAGIGHGHPMNLGALPMVGQVMSSTRGATDILFSGSRHVNNALRNMGVKTVKVGIGCGVGFGYGFGIGLAVKPAVIQKIGVCLTEMIMKMMTKFGMASNSSIGHDALPTSFQSGTSMVNEPSIPNPLRSITQLATKLPGQASEGLQGYRDMVPYSAYENSTSKSSPVGTPFGRTEMTISNFLQNPILKDDTELNEVAGHLRSENNMLQMVLKHQQVIEELTKQNEKLRQILVEELKISPSKLQSSYSTRNKSVCSDCFECRRKQRKSR